MSSVQRAAEKSVKDRKGADNIRIKAGHMLTFDHLVLQPDIVERQVARKVVRKNMIRAAGCLALPLTLMYFLTYVIAARLHEDITNVFFLESTLRMRTDNIFNNVNTVEDLWDALTSKEYNSFLDVFFHQTDIFGSPQVRNLTQEVFGDWGMVESYNQIQGAVRVYQTRKDSVDYNTKYTCNSKISCELCRMNEGFQSIRMFSSRPPVNPDCGTWKGRRLTELGEEEEETEIIALETSNETRSVERRLHLQRPELRTSFPANENADPKDGFRFWLFPSETQDQVLERLNYFRSRNFIDKDTQLLQIRMYLMNVELGRNRLEELSLTFRFSEAGSVYYERYLQTLFLAFWQSMTSMAADGLFILILTLTLCYRIWHMWKAFLNSKLFHHLMSLHTAWEWVIVMFGWYNMFGFYNMLVWEKQVIDALEPIHRRGWEMGQKNVDEISEFFDICDLVSVGTAAIRVIFAQYSIVLMFRFFVSFGSQPRLAIVLRTMQNVLTDFYHFLIVFVPTFMAYVISGSLIFGRRIEAFATIQSSVGTCFRIGMESEYNWLDMSAEFFWAAALWAWSFLLLVVLLFLNMVLAIILDIYNETRESSFPGEAIWETMGQFMTRTRKYRHWVPDKVLDSSLAYAAGLDQGMLTRKDLELEFPDMPDQQKDQFFQACRVEMKWESAKDLTRKNLLKLTGSVMDALDVAHKAVDRVTEDEREDPLSTWVNATPPAPIAHDLKNEQSSNFLLQPFDTKGGKHPKLKLGEYVDECQADGGPEWLQETWTLLRDQRTWIEYANWHCQLMQWQVQQAMESRRYDETISSGAPVL